MPTAEPLPSARELLAALGAGEVNAVELVARVLARIDAVDTAGPMVRSVLAVDPRAGDVAASLDAAVEKTGALHGLPVMVKDNIDVAGMVTTAGSLALSGNVASVDAPVAARLREAGAVIVGKTNLSEWANFRSTRSVSGWSGAGGLTRNPHVLDRSAGGSSSGSGAAVAAGIVPVALGTETDGSILCPAALNGLVGVKPTVGLTSRVGVVPISHTQDTVGPLARTVYDAALVLDVIAEPDAPGGYLAALDLGVAGLRVGVISGATWGRHELLDAHCRAAIAGLTEIGVTVVDDVMLAEPDGLDADEFAVLLNEFKDGVDSYLGPRAAIGSPAAGIPASLAEVAGRNLELGDGELGWFGQQLIEQALAAVGTSGSDYLEAVARSTSGGRSAIDDALAAADVDVLVAPTYPPAWQIDLVNGDRGGLYSMSQLPAVAGYPAVTVPVGMVHGLPVGIGLIGTAWSEAVLLRVAAAIESAVAASGNSVDLGRFLPAVSPNL